MNAKKISFEITGMSCASCAVSNEKALIKTRGIITASVNFAMKKAYIEYDADILGEQSLRQIIITNGYNIKTSSPADGHNHNGTHTYKTGEINKVWRAFIWSAILSLPLLLEMFVQLRTGLFFLKIDIIMWAHLILAAIVVFYFGWRFHFMAMAQAKKFRANMDTLISMGAIVSFFYSFWAVFSDKETYLETAALIITLILLGKYFEAKSTGQAGEAIKKLMELGVKKARRVINDIEEDISIESVKIGDILIVKPSEKIPLDGIVVEGGASIDESMLTGESMPIEKEKGNKVFGATINQDGIIKIKVTQTGEGTALAQIIKIVEKAQEFKAPMQKLADKISGIFVPLVIILSIIAFVGWYFISQNFTLALINAVAVLVIACPCALGLATPTAIMAGTGRGAKSGILFKTGDSFERAKDITMVIFDKTGTLTKAKPEVQKIIPFISDAARWKNNDEDKILKIAASLAQYSEHPLSKAITKYAKEKNIPLAQFKNIKEIRGKGISGFCGEHNIPILLGNKKLLEDNKLTTSLAEKVLLSAELNSNTPLYVVYNHNIIGIIIIADEIRKEAFGIIKSLKRLGLKIAMITGDHKAAALYIAKKLDITNVLAEVLPNEKAHKIKEMQNKGEKVVFIGDGINDAPSLVQADLGIALGSATDIAKEAGQIILMQNNLEKAVEAINISKLTFKTIKQNLFWAFFYNIIAIPLAMAGFLNPIIAAGAMAFSSVSVVLNSLRIYKN